MTDNSIQTEAGWTARQEKLLKSYFPISIFILFTYFTFQIMSTQGFTNQCLVRQCSQCQRDTEYYCNTCKRDLCLQCKESHVIDLDTKHHDVVIYREKYEIPKLEPCLKHTDSYYEKYCYTCELPLCAQCETHEQHQTIDIRTAYKTKREQHREILHRIRSDTLFNNRYQLAVINAEQSKILNLKIKMSTKAQRLNGLIVTGMCAVIDKYRHFMIHRLQQQKRKIKRHLASMEIYEQRYEQSVNRTVKFLVFLKNTFLPKIKDTLNLTQRALLSLTEEIITENVVELLSAIQVTEKQVRDEDLLELMSTPVLHRSVKSKNSGHVVHSTYLTSDLHWISYRYNNTNEIIFKDTEGNTLHGLTKKIPYSRRNFVNVAHTLNNKGELIYLDTGNNIYKFSTDNRTWSLLMKGTDFREWEARCVYRSAFKGELLVGLLNAERTGKVNRYSNTNQHVQTIQHNNRGQGLYSQPNYLTENRNGDVIVSDSFLGVVVTDREGKHRFSYTRHPSGSRLSPNGICTDALSHILVCDGNTHTVQIIDKDGYFLIQILTKEQEIYRPHSLCYENKTNLLWVGSWNENMMCIYKYIKRKSCETGAGEGYL